MSTPGFAESTFVLRLVGVLLSFVCGRLCGGYCGPPTAFPVWAPVYRGCPCRDPPVCHRVQGDSVAKRQPSLCVVVGVLGVVTSCVPCARVPRVSRDVLTTVLAQVQLRILTSSIKIASCCLSSFLGIMNLYVIKWSRCRDTGVDRARRKAGYIALWRRVSKVVEDHRSVCSFLVLSRLLSCRSLWSKLSSPAPLRHSALIPLLSTDFSFLESVNCKHQVFHSEFWDVSDLLMVCIFYHGQHDESVFKSCFAVLLAFSLFVLT